MWKMQRTDKDLQNLDEESLRVYIEGYEVMKGTMIKHADAEALALHAPVLKDYDDYIDHCLEILAKKTGERRTDYRKGQITEV